jgi:hypothetical protein
MDVKVFENRELSRIFGPKREEVVGGWRRLHNEELHIFNMTPNTIREIESRRMRWVGTVACMEEMHTKFWSVNMKGKAHSKDLYIDMRITLEWILGK